MSISDLLKTQVRIQFLPRDPRLLLVTGEFSNPKFREQYSFLLDELKTFRENLKLARQMLASSPRDIREDRQMVVNLLELAVKRAESLLTGIGGR